MCDTSYYASTAGSCEKCDESGWLFSVILLSGLLAIFFVFTTCYKFKLASRVNRTLKSRAKQIFVFTQILVTMSAVYAIKFPSQFESLLNALSFVALNIRVTTGTECIITGISPFYVQLLATTASPLVAIAILAVVPKVAKQRGWWGGRESALESCSAWCTKIAVLLVYCKWSSLG